MSRGESATSRRVFVRGALAGLAGTLGAGAMASAASARPISPGTSVPANLQPATTTKILYATNVVEWDEDTDADGQAGTFDTLVLRGDLAEESNGQVIGDLRGFGFVLHSLITPGTTEYEIFITYTLLLPSGTLVSLGTLTEQNRSFAIVGGTGEYLGAQGSLTVELTAAQGGSLSGTVTLTLLSHQVLLPMVRKNSNG